MVCHKYLQIFCVILVTGLVCAQTSIDDPTAVTIIYDPSALPTTYDPTTLSTTDDPTTLSTTDDPTTLSTTDTPAASTATADPTAAPVTAASPATPSTAAPPATPSTELSTEGIILTCTATQMIVRIPKELLTGDMAGEDVRFENGNSSSCFGEDKVNNTYEFIELATNLTACGTNMTESDDTETYTNRVTNYYGDSISRQYAVDIPLKCSYNRNERVGSVSYKLTDFIINKDLDDDGAYTFSFDIYTDSEYKVVAGPYPTTINIGLNEELYFAASVLSLDGTLDLSIQSCRATPDSNYDTSPMYAFIENGCSNDGSNTNITVLEDRYRIGVEMNTFRFVEDNNDWVYIHCDLLVCDATDEYSVCNDDCAYSSSAIMGRKRRDVSSELKTKRFTRGPLRVVRSAQREGNVLRMDVSENGASAQQEVTNAFNPWIVAMAAMATVVMALTAMMVVVLRKFSKISAAPGRYKEESDRLLNENEEI